LVGPLGTLKCHFTFGSDPPKPKSVSSALALVVFGPPDEGNNACAWVSKLA
jgi:hypothetical protein